MQGVRSRIGIGQRWPLYFSASRSLSRFCSSDCIGSNLTRWVRSVTCDEVHRLLCRAVYLGLTLRSESMFVLCAELASKHIQ